MIGKYFSIFDMAICAVPALTFGVWQLISVEREIARDKAAKALAGVSPEGAGHAVGEHRLDDRGAEAPERKAFVHRLDVLAE